jgi:hypothetical protein
MASISIEENIEKVVVAIEEHTREILRLEGSLRLLKEFKASGVETIELPEPTNKEESES